jgi:hypothetical protein
MAQVEEHLASTTNKIVDLLYCKKKKKKKILDYH